MEQPSEEQQMDINPSAVMKPLVVDKHVERPDFFPDNFFETHNRHVYLGSDTLSFLAYNFEDLMRLFAGYCVQKGTRVLDKRAAMNFFKIYLKHVDKVGKKIRVSSIIFESLKTNVYTVFLER